MNKLTGTNGPCAAWWKYFPAKMARSEKWRWKHSRELTWDLYITFAFLNVTHKLIEIDGNMMQDCPRIMRCSTVLRGVDEQLWWIIVHCPSWLIVSWYMNMRSGILVPVELKSNSGLSNMSMQHRTVEDQWTQFHCLHLNPSLEAKGLLLCNNLLRH